MSTITEASNDGENPYAQALKKFSKFSLIVRNSKADFL
jgi:hypothetical protein